MAVLYNPLWLLFLLLLFLFGRTVYQVGGWVGGRAAAATRAATQTCAAFLQGGSPTSAPPHALCAAVSGSHAS